MLIRHTIRYLPAQCLAPLIQFTSIVVWARLLTPADVGFVTLIIAIQELSFAALFSWWSDYALRFIAGFKDLASRRPFLATETATITVLLLIQSLIFVPALRYYFGDRMSNGTLAAVIAYMLTRSLSNYVCERARSEAAIALYTLVQTAGPFVGLSAGLLLIWAGWPGALSIFLGFALAQALFLPFAFAMSDLARGGMRADPAVLRNAMAFGIPAMVGYLMALVAINAPRFVIEHVAGLAALGRFAVGYGLGLRASSFATMLVTAGAYPLVVRKMELEGLAAAFEQLSKNVVLVAIVVVPVALGLLAVNRSVVNLVVPIDYRDITYAVLPMATIGGLLRYLRAHTTDQVFLVRSRPQYAIVISIVDLLSAVATSFIGLRLYGIPGAAAGPMVSGAVSFLISFAVSRWLGFTIPYLALASVFAAAIGMALVVGAIPSRDGLLDLSAHVGLGMIVYSCLLILVLPVARQAAWGMSRTILRHLRRQRPVRVP